MPMIDVDLYLEIFGCPGMDVGRVVGMAGWVGCGVRKFGDTLPGCRVRTVEGPSFKVD